VESTRVAAIPFFAGLPDAELVAVARRASDLDVATGEAVTNEGDFGHALEREAPEAARRLNGVLAERLERAAD
jgi:hypothetical protein